MRFTRVFIDTDLRCAFEGLRKMVEEAKVAHGPASTHLFINRSQTAFKILHEDKYLVYYKSGHKRIPIDALQYLPESFGGKPLEVTQAIRRLIEVRLSKKSE